MWRRRCLFVACHVYILAHAAQNVKEKLQKILLILYECMFFSTISGIIVAKLEKPGLRRRDGLKGSFFVSIFSLPINGTSAPPGQGQQKFPRFRKGRGIFCASGPGGQP